MKNAEFTITRATKKKNDISLIMDILRIDKFIPYTTHGVNESRIFRIVSYFLTQAPYGDIDAF